MKVRFTLSIGFSGGDYDEVIEFPDGTSERELHEEWEEWSGNYIDGGFDILSKSED